MRKIAVAGNDRQDQHIPLISRLLDIMPAMGLIPCIESSFFDYLCSNGVRLHKALPAPSFPADAFLTLSLGGDGTFLRTAAWMEGASAPIMGVNTGHLGYLTAFSLHDMEALSEALAGDFEISPRITLRVDSPFVPHGFSPFALNEIAVSKGDTTSLVTVDAYIDGHYLACYSADGLIISTPTGSTAYNLSCGGPIMDPSLNCLALTPIAPHSLTLRPLVVSANSILRLRVRSRGVECHIGVDGRTFSVPSEGAELIVCMAPHCVNLVQPRGGNYGELLRRKLHWGEGPLS